MFNQNILFLIYNIFIIFHDAKYNFFLYIFCTTYRAQIKYIKLFASFLDY